MIRGFNFRLLYQVVFVCLCVTYRGGSSRYDRRKEKTELRKIKRQFAEHDPGGGNTKEVQNQLSKTGIKGNF